MFRFFFLSWQGILSWTAEPDWKLVGWFFWSRAPQQMVRRVSLSASHTHLKGTVVRYRLRSVPLVHSDNGWLQRGGGNGGNLRQSTAILRRYTSILYRSNNPDLDPDLKLTTYPQVYKIVPIPLNSTSMPKIPVFNILSVARLGSWSGKTFWIQ
jgi:hypothetical protein